MFAVFVVNLTTRLSVRTAHLRSLSTGSGSLRVRCTRYSAGLLLSAKFSAPFGLIILDSNKNTAGSFHEGNRRPQSSRYYFFGDPGLRPVSSIITSSSGIMTSSSALADFFAGAFRAGSSTTASLSLSAVSSMTVS